MEKMKLTRGARIRARQAVYEQWSTWPLDRLNLLLAEFDIEPVSHPDQSASVLGALKSDTTLAEIHGIVIGADPEPESEAMDGGGTWREGHLRLFISHAAKHREFVGEVAEALAPLGVHGFVAHDTMKYSKPWQAQIEQALQTMEAFVALIHPEFNESAWCHQEVGWAYGRKVPRYAVRVGATPTGFLGHDQWPSASPNDPKGSSRFIGGWIAEHPQLGEPMATGLFTALRDARDYRDAGDAAKAIAALPGLSEERWSALDQIVRDNKQIHGGVLATRELKPFYRSHDRPWPPDSDQAASDGRNR